MIRAVIFDVGGPLDTEVAFEAAIDAVLARLGVALDVDAVRFETIADDENLESTTRVWTRSASMAPSAEPHRVLV